MSLIRSFLSSVECNGLWEALLIATAMRFEVIKYWAIIQFVIVFLFLLKIHRVRPMNCVCQTSGECSLAGLYLSHHKWSSPLFQTHAKVNRSHKKLRIDFTMRLDWRFFSITVRNHLLTEHNEKTSCHADRKTMSRPQNSNLRMSLGKMGRSCARLPDCLPAKPTSDIAASCQWGP